MPDTQTMFSFFSPRSGMKPCTAARIAESPQPGHQRTSWSDLKSLALCWISVFGTSERLLYASPGGGPSSRGMSVLSQGAAGAGLGGVDGGDDLGDGRLE